MTAEQVIQLLDFKLIALIIVSSYWVKKNLSDILPRITLAHKILAWSTFISALYYIALRFLGELTGVSFYSLIISYFAATSFYELAFSPMEKWVRKLLSGSQNKPDTDNPN